MESACGTHDPQTQIPLQANHVAHRQLGHVGHAGHVASLGLGRLDALRVVATYLAHHVQAHQVLSDARIRGGSVPLRQVDVQLRGRPVAPTLLVTAAPGLLLRPLRHEVAGPTIQISGHGPRHRSGRRTTTSRTQTRTLVGEGGVGRSPSGVDPADHRIHRHAGVGEEHLVEHRVTRHLVQRPKFHTVLVHVDGHPGDAAVFGGIGVGPCQEHPEIGSGSQGGPHLLAVDDPLLAVEHGLGRQAREIRAGTGFGEQLAPGLLPGHDVAHIGVDLGSVAVGCDRRRRQQQAQPRRGAQGTERADLAGDSHRVAPRESTAIGIGREVGR